MLGQLSTGAAWTAEIRRLEVQQITDVVNIERGSLLEVGGGAGHQAKQLAEHGLNVRSFDVPNCPFRSDQVFPVETYDGRMFPVDRDSMDWVFSSNVLEHVDDLDSMDAEIKRVLRPAGRAVHVLPTHHWRLWTSVTGPATVADPLLRGLATFKACGERPLYESMIIYAKEALHVARSGVSACVARHGIRGNAWSEYWIYFRPTWWRTFFTLHGWRIVQEFPLNLTYTGNLMLRNRLSLQRRRKLSTLLGSSTVCFVLRRGIGS